MNLEGGREQGKRAIDARHKKMAVSRRVSVVSARKTCCGYFLERVSIRVPLVTGVWIRVGGPTVTLIKSLCAFSIFLVREEFSERS